MQEIYQNPQLLKRRYRVCTVFDMAYGGPLVCFIWLVINMYVAVLAFQQRSPIFSYLNKIALIVQGVICLLFFISALFSLYSFALDSVWLLRTSHRSTWTFVILFLIVYFVTIVLFGVQWPQFNQWCINKSRQQASDYFFSTLPNNNTLLAGSQLMYDARANGHSEYNCRKLWEDEVKFSVIMFVLLFVVYVHFAMCFWRYTQDRWRTMEEMQFEIAKATMMQNNNVFGNNNMMMPNANMMGNNNMMNIAPHKDTLEKEDDGQRSLAQITRAAFGRLR